jgi:hypothetical protein
MVGKYPSLFDKAVLWFRGMHSLVVNAAKSITANGNVTQILPFPGAGLLVLDGNGDYISIPNDIVFGTGDFTFEIWINITSVPDSIQCNILASNTFELHYTPYSSRYLEVQVTNSGTPVGFIGSTGIALVYGAKNHIVYERIGNTFTLFLNGIPIKSVTDTASVGTPSGNIYLGMSNDNKYWFNGSVSEVRISDIARYSGTFIPPKCKFEPDTHTKLLLHFDTNSSTITDSSSYNHTITKYGNVYQIAPRVKDGGLAYFDGTLHSSIQLTNSTNEFGFGSDNFTIECRFRIPSTFTTIGEIISNMSANGWGSYGTWAISINENSVGYITVHWDDYNITSMLLTSSSGGYNDDIEHTVAWVRYGNVHTLYIDGISKATITTSVSMVAKSNSIVCISGDFTYNADNGYPNRYIKGYVSEVRISRGIARYTTDYIPSTERFVPDDYTKLLLHMDGVGQIFLDSPYNDFDEFPIIPAGCTVTNFGTFRKVDLGNNQKVLVFDGSTNYISLSDTDIWNLYENDFTIGFWIKLDSLTNGAVLSQYETGQRCVSLYGYLSATSRIELIGLLSNNNYSFDYYCSFTPTIGIWYYIVIVRKETSCLIYINTISQTVTTLQEWRDVTNMNSPLYIGKTYNIYNHNGNIKDLIIWKGWALTLPEIKELMALTHPVTGRGLIPGPYDYWRLS